MTKVEIMIHAANEFIKETQPTQGEWGEEFVFDFPCETIDENVEVSQVWESKVDEHRWYGLQDLVFKLEYDGEVEYVKTTLVTQSYSEMQSLGDIYHSYPMFKIVHPKEVTTIIYE
jgi:hypothetical protein